MNRLRVLFSLGALVIVLLALALLLTGCGGADAPRLHVTNSGTMPIDGLVVLFPEGEVAFGDVAAGETTDYETVTNGVYRYAAYRFQLDGQEVTQPVIDWMGEESILGQAFTYVLDYDPARSQVLQVQLLEVIQDE